MTFLTLFRHWTRKTEDGLVVRAVHTEKSVSMTQEAFGHCLNMHSSLTHFSISAGPKT